MATFWERAAHSADRMHSLLCLFVTLVVSHFGFEDDCVSSWPLLTIYFLISRQCLLLQQSTPVYIYHYGNFSVMTR